MSVDGFDQGVPPAPRFDPRLSFFAGASHEEALARLEYLAESGQQCGLVTGPKGTGKSTVLRAFAEKSAGHFTIVRTDVAGLGAAETLQCLVEGLGTTSHARGRTSQLWLEAMEALIGCRHARRPCIVIFDHLDRARPDAQELIGRFLSQDAIAATATFVLSFSGHAYPVVAREWRQAADLRIEVGPLTAEETSAFVASLLESLALSKDAFESAAAEIVFRLTQGIPRDIIRLCELSLLSALHDERPTISGEIVEAAMRELSLLRSSA